MFYACNGLTVNVVYNEPQNQVDWWILPPVDILGMSNWTSTQNINSVDQDLLYEVNLWQTKTQKSHTT